MLSLPLSWWSGRSCARFLPERADLQGVVVMGLARPDAQPTPKTPLKSPLSQGGTLFLSNVEPQRDIKDSLKIPSLGGAARRAGGGLVRFPNPPKVPPCPREDAISVERGATTRHERLLCGNC